MFYNTVGFSKRIKNKIVFLLRKTWGIPSGKQMCKIHRIGSVVFSIFEYILTIFSLQRHIFPTCLSWKTLWETRPLIFCSSFSIISYYITLIVNLPIFFIYFLMGLLIYIFYFFFKDVHSLVKNSINIFLTLDRTRFKSELKKHSN